MVRLALSHEDMERLGIKKKSDRDKVRVDLYNQIRKNGLNNTPGVLFQYLRKHWFSRLDLSMKGQRYSPEIIAEIIQLSLYNYNSKYIHEKTGVSISHVQRIANRFIFGSAYGPQSKEYKNKVMEIQNQVTVLYNDKKKALGDPGYSWSQFYDGNTTLIRYHHYLFGPDQKIYNKLLKWYDSNYGTTFLPRKKCEMFTLS